VGRWSAGRSKDFHPQRSPFYPEEAFNEELASIGGSQGAYLRSCEANPPKSCERSADLFPPFPFFRLFQVFSYVGRWSVEPPTVFPGIEGDDALVLKTKAAHHAISAPFDAVLDPKGKPLIVSYEVKLQKGLDCGGAYIKLLSESETVRSLFLVSLFCPPFPPPFPSPPPLLPLDCRPFRSYRR
jgi:hypothetical protein